MRHAPLNCHDTLGADLRALRKSRGHTLTDLAETLGRSVGWVAHWREMISDPKGKIARPRQLYIGAAQRDYVAIEKR